MISGRSFYPSCYIWSLSHGNLFLHMMYIVRLWNQLQYQLFPLVLSLPWDVETSLRAPWVVPFLEQAHMLIFQLRVSALYRWYDSDTTSAIDPELCWLFFHPWPRVMGMLLTHVSSQMGRIFLPCSQMRQPSLAPLKMSDPSSVLSVGMGQEEKSPVDSTPFFLQVEVEFWELYRPLSAHPRSQLWLWVPFIVALGNFRSGSEFPNALLFYWAFLCAWSGPHCVRRMSPMSAASTHHVDEKSAITGQNRNIQIKQPSPA